MYAVVTFTPYGTQLRITTGLRTKAQLASTYWRISQENQKSGLKTKMLREVYGKTSIQ